ncbi:MAG: MBL fold metallo-hydrolase, partial [Parcubacteria group bacterium]|nr:MBL fold metallo-hydrolase [Parcubacteria group bacterium]
AALVNWVGRISGLKKVFVVQGEEGPAGALASRIRDEMGLDVEVPQSGEVREF